MIMKNPILNLKTFLNNTTDISILLSNNDEFSLLDKPFCLEEYQPIIRTVNLKNTEKKDFYKPSKIRGLKANKEGYCLECNKWFRLKNSSYWYHMNFKHGISSKGIKYPDPEIRQSRGKNEGFCELCDNWINLRSGKYENNYKLSWYRHCQKLHKYIY